MWLDSVGRRVAEPGRGKFCAAFSSGGESELVGSGVVVEQLALAARVAAGIAGWVEWKGMGEIASLGTSGGRPPGPRFLAAPSSPAIRGVPEGLGCQVIRHDVTLTRGG